VFLSQVAVLALLAAVVALTDVTIERSAGLEKLSPADQLAGHIERLDYDVRLSVTSDLPWWTTSFEVSAPSGLGVKAG